MDQSDPPDRLWSSPHILHPFWFCVLKLPCVDCSPVVPSLPCFCNFVWWQLCHELWESIPELLIYSTKSLWYHQVSCCLCSLFVQWSDQLGFDWRNCHHIAAQQIHPISCILPQKVALTEVAAYPTSRQWNTLNNLCGHMQTSKVASSGGMWSS